MTLAYITVACMGAALVAVVIDSLLPSAPRGGPDER